jgi:hypothetical protein
MSANDPKRKWAVRRRLTSRIDNAASSEKASAHSRCSRRENRSGGSAVNNQYSESELKEEDILTIEAPDEAIEAAHVLARTM